MIGMEKLTNNFILENKICTLPFDLIKLKDLCNSLEYEVVTYTQGAEVIRTLHLEQYMILKAFTYVSATLKIIFYTDSLPYGEKLFAIAHELGHITLDHTYHGILGLAPETNIANVQEDEADRFACHLLAPPPVLKRCGITTINQIKSLTMVTGDRAEQIYKYIGEYTGTDNDTQIVKQFNRFILSNAPKRDFAAIILFLLLIGSLIVLVCDDIAVRSERADNRNQIIQYQLSQSAADAIGQEIVYVTKYGAKYHLPGCPHIKDREVKELTVDDAISSGYGPCKTCDPPVV